MAKSYKALQAEIASLKSRLTDAVLAGHCYVSSCMVSGMPREKWCPHCLEISTLFAKEELRQKRIRRRRAVARAARRVKENG